MSPDLSKLSTKQLQIKLAQAKEAQLKLAKQNRLTRVLSTFYDWQKRFAAATRDHVICMLMAANQVGKTRTGTAIDAAHLTGDYPDDWEGHRFDGPITAWLLGYSGEKTRDLLQHKIFGRITNRELEGGLIPKDRIISYKSMTGTGGAVKEVLVRHKSGGVSVCQFWSYSQGQHALMGDVIDWFHIDEEPEDQEIYPQVLTRTINGDGGRGGRGILTFTPENGVTELVEQFRDEEVPGQYLQTATWAECPHITPEKAEQILSKYPSYQRDMRSKGVPLQGSGLIFAYGRDELAVEPFQIPEYFKLIDGLDFGWDHPQAHIQLAYDVDNDTIYVTHAWKGSEKQPYEAWHVVKSWAECVPTAWPQDGLQHEKGSARQQMEYYEDAGFSMLGVHATWPDGSNGVEAGLMELNDRMKTGRFKVFSTLDNVFEELQNYHRKAKPDGTSKIVKLRDDLIDAIRYAYMMLRFAEYKTDILNDRDDYDPRPKIVQAHQAPTSYTGY